LTPTHRALRVPSAVEFRILGPLEAVDGDRALALGSTRQRALLALLLTRANEVVSPGTA
jgi:DNA-binding SARP family transcriptional activator